MMEKCPKCGRYMTGNVVTIFGGSKMVWCCPCGYSTERSDTGMQFNTKTDADRCSTGHPKFRP